MYKIFEYSINDKICEIVYGKNIFVKAFKDFSFDKWDKIALIVSDNVYNIYKNQINQVASTIGAIIKNFNDLEKNKEYSYAKSYFQWLLNNNFTRKSLLISIGGGVTNDFVGYLASSYMRGIDCIHVPTTLLSMVDASIGGKVAVNIGMGKNIVGHFHQPKKIISDICFLNSINDIDWLNGFSEILKHALIGDNVSLDILQNKILKYKTNSDDLFKLIHESIKFKSNIVMNDETEKGLRAILNFGHTIGHAIESLFNYKVQHGEAVAIGILIESYISQLQGLLKKDEFDIIVDLLKKYKLIKKLSFDNLKLLNHMIYDKKNVFGKIKFVLLNGIGKPLIGQDIPQDIIIKGLDYYKGSI